MTMTDSDNTVSKTLEKIEAVLKKANIKSAGCEAEILLCHFLKLKKMELFFKADQCIDAEILGKIYQAVNKRSNNIPLQYITGIAHFFGLEFAVKEGVFIPRAETEVLVDRLIKLARKEFLKKLKILELCTGSGNIPIALTKNIHYCKIVSSDISPVSLKAAKLNALKNGVNSRIKFIEGDLFKALNGGNNSDSFDWIIANPPYVDAKGMSQLPQDVCLEPEQALSGGPDGLEFYRRIVSGCGTYLKLNGYIAFEFGDEQMGAVRQIISSSNMFDSIEFFADLNGICRFVIARRANG